MGRRNQSPFLRYVVAFAIALVLHVPLAAGLRWVVLDPMNRAAEMAAASNAAPITLLTPAQVQSLLERADRSAAAVTSDAVAVAPAPEPEKPKTEVLPGQVVEIPPPPREAIPDHADLLSNYNSKVEKESVSRDNRAPSPRMVKSDRLLISRGDDEKGTARSQDQASKEKAEEADARARSEKPGPGEKPDDSEVVGTPDADDRSARVDLPGVPDLQRGDGMYRGAEQGERMHLRRGGEGPGGGSGAPTDYRSLLPSMGPQEMARSDGSIDHIEGVEYGDGTFLNTREYKYAWFFNRVKRSVKEHWRPGGAYRLRDPYGRVHGVRDRLTVVEVTLNADGNLENIYIKQDSGVAFLDEVAVEAFQKASPFPNPPDGLKDENGLITFRFAFYLEFGNNGVGFFRYD